MSAPTIVSIRNFDINRVSFVVGPTKPGRSPSISLKYDGQNFQLRLPSKMSVRLWASQGMDNASDKMSYSLTTNLKDCDHYARERATGTSDMDMLYNLIVFDLKQKILDTAEEKSKQWFGKPRSRAALEDGFKDMFRLSADKVNGETVPNGKYPPSFRVKIPTYDGKVGTDVINESGNPVYMTPDTLDKVFENNIQVNMVVVPSIWVISGGGFGVSWKLTYAQVFPRPRLNAATVFMAEETQDGAEEAPAAEATEAPRPTTPPEESPAPAAAAPARKKRAPAGQV